MIAADHPFLDILWTMIIFFTWVVWLWMMFFVLSDVFRRRDIGGWRKAAWTIFMIVLPFLGVLAYLIAQHDGIQERQLERAGAAQQRFDEHVRAVAAHDGAGTGVDEIGKAHQPFEKGAITTQEFDSIKTKALATSTEMSAKHAPTDRLAAGAGRAAGIAEDTVVSGLRAVYHQFAQQLGSIQDDLAAVGVLTAGPRSTRIEVP